MKFWFCETCGKRLTDKDIEEGLARNKKLKGVFCKECAVGVMTMEMIPLSESQAKKILKNNAQEVSDSVSGKEPQQAVHARIPARTHGAASRHSGEKISPAVIAACAAVVVVIVLACVLALSGKAKPVASVDPKPLPTATVQAKETHRPIPIEPPVAASSPVSDAIEKPVPPELAKVDPAPTPQPAQMAPSVLIGILEQHPSGKPPVDSQTFKNLALASTGAVPLAHRPFRQDASLNDGVFTGYGQMNGIADCYWPDGWLGVRLKEPQMIDCITFLLWDKDNRSYQYKAQVCPDSNGQNWTPLVDTVASNLPCRAWQKISFPPLKVQEIRVHAGRNTANNLFHIVELQAFCLSAQGAGKEIQAAKSLRDQKNHALASNGAVVSGAERAHSLIDGVLQPEEDNHFAYAGLNVPMTVTLKEPTLINCVRMLLWDRDDRFYRFKLEVGDGTTWTMVEDKSEAPHECRGWQVCSFPERIVKQIRLTGTHNSRSATNRTFHVTEVEAYHVPPLEPPPPAHNDQQLLQSFFSDLTALLQKRDVRGASALLNDALKNERLKNREKELSEYKKLIPLFEQLEVMVGRGLEKVKDLDQFDLKLAKGDTMTVGKRGQFRISEIKDGTMVLSNQGISMRIAFENIERSTREQLMLQALGTEGSDAVLRALLLFVKSQDADPPTASTLRSAIERARSQGPEGALLMQLYENQLKAR
jgi:hypothetical protein